MPSNCLTATEKIGMLGARSIVVAASCLLAAAFLASAPAATAQTVDLSLNVFYSNPMDTGSGGAWSLVGKSSNFGIVGLDVRLTNIATSANAAPRGTVNGSDAAGFNIFADSTFATYRDLSIGQAPILPLPSGDEQGAFYGVGQFANGAPNYPSKPGGTMSEGPSIASLTATIGIPWATGDAFSDANWLNGALLATGTFTTGVTPAFVAGSSGNVFTSLGTSTDFGTIAGATLSTIVRSNFVPGSADYNHNGIVDAADYILWRHTLGQSVTPGTGADGNGDGTINQPDYNLWRAHFGLASGAGSGASLSTSAVPEPLSGLLAMIAAVVFAGSYRRRSGRESMVEGLGPEHRCWPSILNPQP